MMSIYSDIKVQYGERADATSSYNVLKRFDLENDCEEGTGLARFKIGASTGPEEVSLGSVDKGKVLLFVAESALTVHINGSGNTSFTGTFGLIELDDTTGLTSLHVTNDNSSAVYYRVAVVGDVASS